MCREDLPQSVIFTAHRGLPCIETRRRRIETFVNADLGPHIAPSEAATPRPATFLPDPL